MELYIFLTVTSPEVFCRKKKLRFIHACNRSLPFHLWEELIVLSLILIQIILLAMPQLPSLVNCRGSQTCGLFTGDMQTTWEFHISGNSSHFCLYLVIQRNIFKKELFTKLSPVSWLAAHIGCTPLQFFLLERIHEPNSARTCFFHGLWWCRGRFCCWGRGQWTHSWGFALKGNPPPSVPIGHSQELLLLQANQIWETLDSCINIQFCSITTFPCFWTV